MPRSTGYDGVFIVGAGQAPYEKRADRPVQRVLWEALDAALRSAGLAMRDVDGLAATAFVLPPDNVTTLAEHFGLAPRWLFQGLYGGASGVVSVLPHRARRSGAGAARRGRRPRRRRRHPRKGWIVTTETHETTDAPSAAPAAPRERRTARDRADARTVAASPRAGPRRLRRGRDRHGARARRADGRGAGAAHRARPCAARPHHRQPLLRALDAHARLVRAGRQGAGRGRALGERQHVVGPEGRVADRHGADNARDGRRHPRDAARLSGCALPRREAHRRRDRQRRRRRTRAPDPGAARPLHDAAPLRRPVRAACRHGRRHRPLARGALGPLGPLRDGRGGGRLRAAHAAAARPAPRRPPRSTPSPRSPTSRSRRTSSARSRARTW